MIGLGVRGVELSLFFQQDRRVSVAGVADPYDGKLARGKELFGEKTEVVRDYRNLLNRDDIDAVVVATPDHLHAEICLQCARAGKHIYCETPLTHQLGEGSTLLEAVRASRCVFQAGNFWLSTPICSRAREMVKEGSLGNIYLITGHWYTNSALNAWQTPFPPDASPETVGFELFDPDQEFDLDRYFRWPRYAEYGAGLAGTRFCQQLGVIQWIMDVDHPLRVSAQGGVLRWKDGRQAADTMNATYEYDSFVVNLSTSQTADSVGSQLRFWGTEASLILDGKSLGLVPASDSEPYRRLAESWPEPYRDWFYMMHGLSPGGGLRRPGSMEMEKQEETFSVPEGIDLRVFHVRDFLDAISEGREAQEPAQRANWAAIAAHLANLSSERKESVVWEVAGERGELL